MQNWPSIEEFLDQSGTGGPGPYGTCPDRYVSIVPRVTPETATGYSLEFQPAVPFDGYQQVIGGGAGSCAMALEAGATTSEAGAWVIERSVVGLEVDVSASYAIRATGGSFDTTTFRQFGVCACVGGGTLNSGGTAAEAFRNVTGYFLIETKIPSLARHRVILMEFVAGAITVLASEDVADRDIEHFNGNSTGFFEPRPLRLNVVSDGGSGAELRAYRSPFQGPEVLLFGQAVPRATALAPGRCGFGIQTRFLSATGSLPIGLIDFFRIRPGDTSSVLFADEFRRWNRLATRSVSDSLFAGRSLASAWSGDGESVDTSTPIARLLLRETAGAPTSAIEVGDLSASPANAFPGYHISQDPASGPIQRVVASFTRTSGDAAVGVEMGVAVRFSAEPFPTGQLDLRGRRPPLGLGDRVDHYKRGYIAAVVYASGPTWTLEVRHHDGSTDVNYEAPVIATGDVSAASLAVGAAFTLDVEAQSFDGTSLGAGAFVALLIKVQGITITPVPASIAGISVIDDFLIDERSSATLDAGSNGFVIIPTAGTTTAVVEVNSIERATPQAEFDDPAEDELSVAIPTEDAATSGTLSVPLDATIDERFTDDVIVHRMETGAKNVIASNDAERRVFGVSCTLDEGEWQSLEALYESNGASIPFDWTKPDTGEALRGLFVEDSLVEVDVYVENGRVVKQMRFEIEEVFGALLLNPEL